ncbi:Transcription regulator [Clostridiaceae bacterium JG1575]|nr:Transcription regulator [Clostridiaceae bacterium JG1575]
MMKRVLFFYNPGSGDGRIKQQLDAVHSLYQRYGYVVDVRRLDDSLRSLPQFTEPEGFYDHVLVAGGDGTAQTMVQQMKDHGWSVPLGILPMGTANDYATYIGMPQDLEEGLRQILTLPAQEMDLGHANNSVFINVFSCGYFVDISQKTDKDLKNSIGWLAYFLKSIEKIRDLRPNHVRLKSKEFSYEGDMLMLLVFNGNSAGGMKVALKSRGNDGVLDVLMLKGGNWTESVPAVVRLLRGDMTVLNDPALVWFQTDHLVVEAASEVPTDIDGEKGPSFPVDIRCERAGMQVLGVRGTL